MGGIIPVWKKDLCIDCDICIKACPKNAISKNDEDYFRDEEKCMNFFWDKIFSATDIFVFCFYLLSV